MGPHHISEIIRARKLKFYIHLDGPSALFGNEMFFHKEASQGCSTPSVNLGPLNISETIKARMLKFYTHLDTISTVLGMTVYPLGGVEGGADREASSCNGSQLPRFLVMISMNLVCSVCIYNT